MKSVIRHLEVLGRALIGLCLLLPRLAQSNEGFPKQLDTESAQIILGICQNNSGKVLTVGRAHSGSTTPKFYPGSVQQFTTDSTIGVTADATFQKRGATVSNLNVSNLEAKENGAAYYDAGNTQKENLLVSCAYNSARSAWWAAGRGVKSTASGNRYVVYLYYIPIAGGTPTAFDTGIGGDADNDSNNKHGFLGGPKSLVFDSANDMLYVTGYQGQFFLTSFYRPYIAQFKITSNTPTLSTKKLVALTTINNSSATGWRGVGITQISAGGNVYGIASRISASSSGFEAFDYTPATWNGSTWSGGEASRAAVSLTGYTNFVKPTSIVNNGSNKLYVVGAAKNSSSSQFGFIASLTTALALDTTGFNSSNGFRATQINDKTTGYNDVVYISDAQCDSGTARIFVAGSNYNGTNNKMLIGKFTTAGALADWGTSGHVSLPEFSHNEIATAITFDTSNNTLVYAGRVMTKNDKWVYKSSGYVRTLASCSAETPVKYLTGCQTESKLNGEDPGGNFTINKASTSTFTGNFKFTYSSGNPTTGNSGSLAACVSSDTTKVSLPSSGTFTASEMTSANNPVTITCQIGSSLYETKACGTWTVTVLSSAYGPGGNTTQMYAMLSPATTKRYGFTWGSSLQ